MSHTATARRTAAAAIRAIGIQAHHDHLCARCSVTWNGAEADCWSCGLPATSEYTHPGAALQILLTTIGCALTRPTAQQAIL